MHKDHQKQIEALIDAYDDRIRNLTDRQKSALIKRIEFLLRKHPLDLRENGQIKSTTHNIAQARRIMREASSTLFPNYLANAVNGFGAITLTIEKANLDLIRGIKPDFRNTSVYQSIRTDAIASTLQNMNPDGFKAILERPIERTLQRYIRAKRPIRDLVSFLGKAIANEPVNRPIDRTLKAYYRNYHDVRRLFRDSLFSYSAEYLHETANGAGVEWYFYSGGLVQESRGYCVARAGRYWHAKEIEKDAVKDWKGKRRGTNRYNIYTNRGGYNCRHAYIPVAASVVPMRDQRRAAKKGFWVIAA